MAWVRIHDAALTHPKVVGLSDKAFRLWVWGLSYSQQHLTDGLIEPAAIPGRLGRAAPDLVVRRLWEPHDVGYKVHDYLDWNDSREMVLAKREGARQRLTTYKEKRVSSPTSESSLQRVASLTSETLLARSGVGKSGSFSGKGAGENPADDALLERAGRLREELYPAWYAKYRHGARLRLVANSLELEEAVTLCRTWDDARLEKLARIVLTTDDDWIARTDRGFKIFCLKCSWADDRLRQVENGSAA